MPFYTYILRSEKTGKLYIGQTGNLEKRILLHNSNQVISTRNKGPWSILFYKESATRSESVKLELMLKSFRNGIIRNHED